MLQLGIIILIFGALLGVGWIVNMGLIIILLPLLLFLFVVAIVAGILWVIVDEIRRGGD